MNIKNVSFWITSLKFASKNNYSKGSMTDLQHFFSNSEYRFESYPIPDFATSTGITRLDFFLE